MTDPAHRYRVFGLVAESDIPLPELVPDVTQAPADLTIRRTHIGGRDGLTPAEEFGGVLSLFTPEADLLFWPQVGAFRVRGVASIDYDPNEGVEASLISQPLLGAVLALSLRRRGLLTLHGSAVELSAGAAIFLGDKGAGKSTTAATMVNAGFPLLTDDVVAIKTGGSPRLFPGYPLVKLTAEAESAVRIESRQLPSPHPGFGKARLRVEADFDVRPRRPVAALVLVRGQELALNRIAGAEALTALMRFSFSTRFGSSLTRGKIAAEHLAQCASLTREIFVGTLTVPHSLDRLGAVPEWLDREISIQANGVT